MIKIRNYSLNEFQDLVNQDQKFVVFCAGQALQSLCAEYHMEKNIVYAVDNHRSGRSVSINGSQIPVIAVDDVGEEIQDVLCIITSFRYTVDIIHQLDKLPQFDDVIFLVPYIFTEGLEEKYEIFKSHEVPRIPKIIHYCWFGREEIPERFKQNIETWKKCCPDYEIRCWSEDNYDVTKNRYMKQAYDAKRWGFVPDFARLDIINTYGGIYLDTDIEVIKTFDDLLGFDMFCGFESSRYIAFGLGFASIPNNEILKAMMKQYEEIEFIKTDGTLNLTASPVYQTKVIEQFGIHINGKTQVKNNMVVLSPEYLAPINSIGVGKPTDKTYSIHQYAATWTDEVHKKNKREVTEIIKVVVAHMI